ncbi:MAG: hypothetical protein ACREQY_13490, partial [Candidatus Binatia bacterium]
MAVRTLVIACVAAFAACQRALPEEGSEAAELYRLRCGSCHRVFSPGATKFATWEMILPRMEAHIARSGQ